MSSLDSWAISVSKLATRSLGNSFVFLTQFMKYAYSKWPAELGLGKCSPEMALVGFKEFNFRLSHVVFTKFKACLVIASKLQQDCRSLFALQMTPLAFCLCKTKNSSKFWSER